ncbi:MAG: phosphotriesterase, partial [Bryobacteraceae bacterium]
MRRREFLSLLPGALQGATAPLHTILVHEHVMVDFRGADQAHPGPYDPEAVFRIAKPKLDDIYKLGCRRFQDATPNFLGRDTKLLRKLADATGLEIWTNTGLYAARDHKFLPAYAKPETAEQIAARWTAEFRNGVDGMKPGFIKIGVNRAPLGDLDRKIVRAAAICSKQTGLTIASHTAGSGPAAIEQLQ